MVGTGEGADVVVTPITFQGKCENRGDVPHGCPEVEERFVCARFHCQTGERTGNDCLACEHYRGWRDGPGLAHVTVTCFWSSDAPVWQRMTRASLLVTVPPELTVAMAARRALEADVHHLVVTSNGELVGVVCRCDLGGHRADDTVADCLPPRVLVISSSATLGEAAGAMEEHGVGCLPVIEDGRLVGLISHGDLSRVGGPPEESRLDERDLGEGD
jgi:hypothetical protein